MAVKSKETFSNEMFGELTVIRNHKDEIFFIGKEVAEKLGYTNPQKAIRDHCKGVNESLLPSAGGAQLTKIIPESDVYRLVMRSKKEEAERFQDWVVEDVLPSIRKRGMYATDNVVDKFLNDPDFAIKLLTEYKEEKQRRKEEEEKRIAAEERLELLSHTERTYTATELAKECGFSSAILFNKFLEKHEIQFKKNKLWLPHAQYSTQGYYETKQQIVNNKKEVYYSKFTQKGR